MRKMWVLGLLAAASMLSVVPAVVAHDDDDQGDDNGKWKFHGEIRGRMEYVDNYLDLQDSDSNGNFRDSNWFAPYRVKMSMDGRLTDNVRAMVELNYVSVYGLEDPIKDTTFPPYQGSYYSFDRGGYYYGNGGVRIHQAIMEVDKIGGTNFDLRIGRQEHTFGTQLFLGNNDFYGGTSFDGARLMYNTDKFNWDLFYYTLSEGNFPYYTNFPPGGANDVDLLGSTFTWNLTKWGQVQAYLFDLSHQGSYPFSLSYFGLPPDSKVYTYGGRWGRMVESVDDVHNGMFDWNIELAGQSGDAGNPYFTGCANNKCDITGSIGEAWFGFNWAHGATSRSRVHIGAYMSSGDKESTLNKSEDFTSLFMNTQVYNRLGDADYIDAFGPSDLEDWNAGYEFYGGRHMFGVYYHRFTEAEPFDGASDDLGNEYDLSYSFQWKPNVNIASGYDVFNPGKAFDFNDGKGGVFNADKLTRFWVQMRTRW